MCQWEWVAFSVLYDLIVNSASLLTFAMVVIWWVIDCCEFDSPVFRWVLDHDYLTALVEFFNLNASLKPHIRNLLFTHIVLVLTNDNQPCCLIIKVNRIIYRMDLQKLCLSWWEFDLKLDILLHRYRSYVLAVFVDQLHIYGNNSIFLSE